MKQLLIATLVIAAIVAGVGAYRGWFTVDKQKLEQDENAVKTAVHDLEKKVENKAADWNTPAKNTK